jgi:hypothetical protein
MNGIFIVKISEHQRPGLFASADAVVMPDGA